MIKPWKVLQSKDTFRDRWLGVRTDRCEMPSGKIIEGYHVLDYPNWINVVALTEKLEILLVRQYRHGAGKVLDELPSGVIEAGEPPREAAARELMEETGYSSDVLIEVGSYSPNPATQANTCYTFFAPHARLTGDTHFDDAEDLELVIAPFRRYLENTWKGTAPIQGLHAAALHFTIGYVLRSGAGEFPELRELMAEVPK